MPDKQMIFIIGSPRSGTTWLQTMIGAHPQVATTVELTLFSRYTAPWLKAWESEAAHIRQGDWEQGLPYIWSDKQFMGFLREFLERAYERIVQPETTHILDKHPAYSFFVEDINKLLPKARFIHAIRDGRDVAVSMMDARKRYGFGTDTITASAAEWKEMVVAAQKAKQFEAAPESRYMEVRYESLKSAGVDVLSALFDFCDLPASREEVAAIIEAHDMKKMKKMQTMQPKEKKRVQTMHRRGRVGSYQCELTPRQKYFFEHKAGDLLRELGYAEEGWWADSRRQRVSLPVEASILLWLSRLRDATALLIGSTLTQRMRGTRVAQVTLDKLARSLA
jgi:hypothetical protein